MGSIKKSTLYHILFTLCVALPAINIYEVTFAVWSLTVLVTLKAKYSFNFIKYCAYFALIMLIAVISASFRDFKMYAYFKDITILAKPIIGLLLGYQLLRVNSLNPARVVINTAVFIGAAHLAVIVFSIVFLNIRNMHDLRGNSGYFNDFEVYGLLFIVFHKRLGVPLTVKQYRIFLAISAMSVLLYMARTNYMQFVILYMAIKGYFVLNKTSITVFSSVLCFVLVSYTIIYNANPRRNSRGIEAFFYKIKIAPQEAFKTKVDVNDWRDFNDNYRSYENIRVMRQVSNDGPAAVAFGLGMGSFVDLRQEVYLQNSWMRYIPFLHNGFMTVFLKSGLLGIFIYLQTIIFFFRKRRSGDDIRIKSLNRILFGTGIFIIISNWVFLGFYNLYDSKIILVGFIVAYREYLLKNTNEEFSGSTPV